MNDDDQIETYEEVVLHDVLGTFKSIANSKLGNWDTPTFELVDNATDKGSRQIVMTFDPSKRTFAIEDDGAGCNQFNVFFGLGNHKRTEDTKIGKYGYGMKHGLLVIGNDVACPITISSAHGSQLFKTKTSFAQVAKDGKVPVKKQQRGSSRGTRIFLEGVRRTLPVKKPDLDRLICSLGFTYSLYLEEGKTILIDVVRGEEKERHSVAAYVPPKFSQTVSDEFQLDAGRRVRLHVGIVAQGEAVRWAGLHYRYAGRVIERSSDRGCNGYGMGRVFGYVDLIGDWNVATLKDEVYDTGTLAGEVFKRIEALLKNAQTQVMLAETAAVTAEAEQLLTAAVGGLTEKGRRGRRPYRRPLKPPGVPKGTGKGHKDAKQRQPGGAMPPKQGGRFHIDYAELYDEALGDMAGKLTVRLNTRVDGVCRAKAEGDATLLFTMAMMVYSAYDKLQDESDRKALLIQLGKALSRHGESKLDGRAVGTAERPPRGRRPAPREETVAEAPA